MYADPLAAWKPQWPEWVTAPILSLGLTKLPDHLHEVILFAVFYELLFCVSSLVSPHLVPEYRNLSPRTKYNFDMHVASHVNAILLCALSFPMLGGDPNLTTLTSYTPWAGLLCAAAVGYFIWDTWVSSKHSSLFGMGFVLHAVAALITFLQAFYPFMLNYAAPFVWFEASTPFVNIHWFATHVKGLVSERLYKINGLGLLTVFFLCRILSGPIYGFKMFREAFTTELPGVPTWAVIVVLTCYLSLVFLNFFWFSKMIRIALKSVSKKRD